MGTYEILSRILHDNDAEIHRAAPSSYADGLAAAGARLRAAMAGLPRSGDDGSGWHGGSYDPKPESHGPSDQPARSAITSRDAGRVIEADYTVIDEREPARIWQDP